MKEYNFESFIKQLYPTNKVLDYFCDFNKIRDKVEEVRLDLCMLNSLIGTTDLTKSVQTLFNRDKNVFRRLHLLVAERDPNTSVLSSINEWETASISSYFDSVPGIVTFLEQTGLAKILQEKQIRDLTDYYFGIETGLDTNSRKNRTGQLMEEMIAEMFRRNGIPFKREVCSDTWSDLHSILGADRKRFDFAVQAKETVFLIEVNFYNTGGSKPQEVARSYTELAPRINEVRGFEFVWITDGQGWIGSQKMLREAYKTIPRVYNLTTIISFIESLKSLL